VHHLRSQHIAFAVVGMVQAVGSPVAKGRYTAVGAEGDGQSPNAISITAGSCFDGKRGMCVHHRADAGII